MAGGQGAAGTGYYGFNVVNRGNECQLGGYFGVSIYDPSGHLITAEDHRLSDMRDDLAAQPVALAPGAVAHFTVSAIESPMGDPPEPCPTIGAFHLIPPNDTAFDQVSLIPNPRDQHFIYCGKGLNVQPTRLGPSDFS